MLMDDSWTAEAFEFPLLYLHLYDFGMHVINGRGCRGFKRSSEVHFIPEVIIEIQSAQRWLCFSRWVGWVTEPGDEMIMGEWERDTQRNQKWWEMWRCNDSIWFSDCKHSWLSRKYTACWVSRLYGIVSLFLSSCKYLNISWHVNHDLTSVWKSKAMAVVVMVHVIFAALSAFTSALYLLTTPPFAYAEEKSHFLRQNAFLDDLQWV